MARVGFSGLVLLLAACGYKPLDRLCPNQMPPGAGGDCAGSSGDAGCVGLGCNVTDCVARSMPPTTLSGTVFAPNGTLPLYGVTVYVPNTDPGAFLPGAQCDTCINGLPGHPIAQTTTDDKGRFSLEGVPDGADIPVVITIGKWRRQIKVASVAACATRPLDAIDTTLPRSHDDLTPSSTSVDMPQIAISTGAADSLECLVRRLGIADKEITTDTQGGKIHLFADTQANATSNGVGVTRFDAGFGGGAGNLGNSQALWGTATDPGKLGNYDLVILSCEGAQHAETKPQEAMDHLKAYADLGGRVFLSHWHNVWLEGSTQDTAFAAKPAVWTGIASFDDNGADTGPTTIDTVDEVEQPKGHVVRQLDVERGSIERARSGADSERHRQTHRTSGRQRPRSSAGCTGRRPRTSFLRISSSPRPTRQRSEDRCGKVVFSDMHVSGGPIQVGGPARRTRPAAAPVRACRSRRRRSRSCSSTCRRASSASDAAVISHALTGREDDLQNPLTLLDEHAPHLGSELGQAGGSLGILRRPPSTYRSWSLPSSTTNVFTISRSSMRRFFDIFFMMSIPSPFEANKQPTCHLHPAERSLAGRDRSP